MFHESSEHKSIRSHDNDRTDYVARDWSKITSIISSGQVRFRKIDTDVLSITPDGQVARDMTTHDFRRVRDEKSNNVVTIPARIRTHKYTKCCTDLSSEADKSKWDESEKS